MTEEQRKRLVAAAIEQADKLAESQLEIAKLFLAYGKPDVARRRLELVIEQYGESRFVGESRELLTTLGRRSGRKSSSAKALVESQA